MMPSVFLGLSMPPLSFAFLSCLLFSYLPFRTLGQTKTIQTAIPVR